MVIPLQHVLVGAQIAKRQINLRRAHHPHFVRQNSHDLARDGVDDQLLAEHLWRTGKLPPPESFADECDLAPARHVFRFEKIAPENRRQPDHAHHVPAHDSAIDPFRRSFPAGTGEVERAAPVDREIGKAALRRPPIEVVGVADRARFKKLHPLAQEEESLGLGIRQRAQQNSVDDAENGDVGPNPEREGEDGDGAERRRLEQHADGVAQILHQIACDGGSDFIAKNSS